MPGKPAQREVLLPLEPPASTLNPGKIQPKCNSTNIAEKNAGRPPDGTSKGFITDPNSSQNHRNYNLEPVLEGHAVKNMRIANPYNNCNVLSTYRPSQKPNFLSISGSRKVLDPLRMGFQKQLAKYYHFCMKTIKKTISDGPGWTPRYSKKLWKINLLLVRRFSAPPSGPKVAWMGGTGAKMDAEIHAKCISK